MARFSEIFNINKQQAEIDFVDIEPGNDTPLYIDPYALTAREDWLSENCHDHVISFFQNIIQCIAQNDRIRGIRYLSKLGEPEETHLGVSDAGNKGRGIGEVQAREIWMALKSSKSAASGILEDLTDFALFIPGIGRDKISDITTNIIREPLIEYTQSQCHLYNIPMQRVASGFFWSIENNNWQQDYVDLPIFNTEKIILVPKYMVRYQVGVDHTEYRNKFVLEFLQAEHLRADDALVTTLISKKGIRKVVHKKTVDGHYPKTKEFLDKFSVSHPEVIDKYRERLKDLASKIPNIDGENYNERDLALVLIDHLNNIKAGNQFANEYHNFCLGAISFIFFPNLIYPKKEREINEGRKRIDITYTNGKESGFFYRISHDKNIKANTIHVECKNYNNEIANPEVDQIVGRFNNNRGRLGLLLFRKSDNLLLLKNRCRDVCNQGNGIVLPIDDSFLKQCLAHISEGNRRRIDREIDLLYQDIIS